jgi:uridine kinase
MVEPERLIILEGFLALVYPELRELYDYSVYLDAPFDKSIERRVHDMPDGYKETVVRGMHTKYVAASKQYASLVVDVVNNDQQTVLSRVLDAVKPMLGLNSSLIHTSQLKRSVYYYFLY